MAKPRIEIIFDKKSITKLKAVAKHVQALADELEEIENGIECPKCEGIMDTNKLYAKDKMLSIFAQCPSCGFVINKDFRQ